MDRTGGVFSTLRLIDTESDERDQNADDVLKDSIMRGKYSVLYNAAHGKHQTVLHLQFKTLELFGEK